MVVNLIRNYADLGNFSMEFFFFFIQSLSFLQVSQTNLQFALHLGSVSHKKEKQ